MGVGGLFVILPILKLYSFGCRLWVQQFQQLLGTRDEGKALFGHGSSLFLEKIGAKCPL
jgi:hypothetical protein